MNTSRDILATKTVNALVPNAEAQGFVTKAAGTDVVLAAFKAVYKGLWVGGTLSLTSFSLEFQPNLLNRFVHKGETGRTINLVDVLGVEDRFGILTHIVNITCRNDPPFTFRCYGAKQFTEQIRGQMVILQRAAHNL